MAGLFVTATGTELGKTYVMTALIREARAAGRAVVALKPVASGIAPGAEADSDPGLILTALSEPVTAGALARVTPWRFPAPLSPDMAATLAGVALRFAEVRAWCAVRLAGAAGALALVEGAGGVMSPIAEDALNIDLIAALGLPVALVAGSYLGTISHTLTALEALRIRNIAVKAVLLSETPGATVGLGPTAVALARRGAGPVIALPRGAAPPDLLGPLGLGASD